MSDRKVTVVVPVYADWPSLKDCITSLKQYLDQRHKVLLVNDCGPEVDILEKNIKVAVANLPNFEYHRNSENQGFVKTCNRAVFELDKTNNDILLLNSDTKVTKGFLEELLDLLSNYPKIGAVSPRSNNANNCTMPLAAFISKRGIKPEKSYKLFLKYKNKFPRHHVMPTANGFCMLIRRSVIKKYGLFDEAFGMGYGEEVDFCQRIAQYGWVSSLSNRAFVYHLEARSFSPARKAAILEVSVKMIRERWPNFKPAITKNIEDSLLNEKKIMGKDAGNEVPYGLSRTKVVVKRAIRRYPKVHRLALNMRSYLRR